LPNFLLWQKIGIQAKILQDGLNSLRSYADSTSRWISEKLDGIRAFWDGKKLYSKHGTPMAAPSYFTDQFPSFPLDGELWMGSQTFQRITSLLQSKDPSLWKQTVFCVFDAPMINAQYEDRMKALEQLNKGTYIQVIKPHKCLGQEHFNKFFNDILSKGGEGVILRAAASKYESGRSSSFYKLKVHLSLYGNY
jgi:DNA ligase-1